MYTFVEYIIMVACLHFIPVKKYPVLFVFIVNSITDTNIKFVSTYKKVQFVYALMKTK